jgi:hypothetical protein
MYLSPARHGGEGSTPDLERLHRVQLANPLLCRMRFARLIPSQRKKLIRSRVFFENSSVVLMQLSLYIT